MADDNPPRYQPKNFRLDEDYAYVAPDAARSYLFTEPVAIAVDVAIETRRPLLVAGPPGCGKTMLAVAMAALLGWRYAKHTFTSRSRLEELTAGVDRLRRLHDAQAARAGTKALPEWAYQEPGILWWMFRPESARLRGRSEDEVQALAQDPDTPYQPPASPEIHGRPESPNAVLLLDEIDKAEPDLPNDLLEPLDRMRFDPPIGRTVSAHEGMRMLVLITTNGERELPPAFLRRCVSLVLEHPGKERLKAIARQHREDADEAILEPLAAAVVGLRPAARSQGIREPSTSEYLDAVNAAHDLREQLGVDHLQDWIERLRSATLLKRTDWDQDGPDDGA